MPRSRKHSAADGSARTWAEDVKRVQEIAVSAGVEGYAINPAEVLEMLCIFNRYERGPRDELINFVATELYPFTDEGEKAIERFIEEAKAGGVP
jgi:hypothetical protein